MSKVATCYWEDTFAVAARICFQLLLQFYASENWQEKSPKGSLFSNPNPLNVSCHTAIMKGEITPLVRLTSLNLSSIITVVIDLEYP
jgi:hypothetical protein